MFALVKDKVFFVEAICDIGLMSFAYDMRRLHEILAFPKAWYSPTLMRHLFTGHETTTAADAGENLYQGK